MKHFDWLSRTALLTGKEALEHLSTRHVIVVGLGGIGSYAAEMLVRAGIGKVTLVDGDIIDRTNRNRQLPALFSTEGMSKVQWMYKRLLDVNPEVEIIPMEQFILPDSISTLLASRPDYVIDAIDSVTPKVALLELCHTNKIPIIANMGAGGKLDPLRVHVADISRSHTCKLARVIRQRLKHLGIRKGIKVVFSDEPVIESSVQVTDGSNFKKSYYGTISYLPCIFGCVAASVVIRDFINSCDQD